MKEIDNILAEQNEKYYQNELENIKTNKNRHN